MKTTAPIADVFQASSAGALQRAAQGDAPAARSAREDRDGSLRSLQRDDRLRRCLHLDHNERGGWLGPAHAKCNLRAGWEKMTGRDAVNGDGEAADEPPRLWSQRWTSDPPVGTQVLLRGGMCEVYLGGGWWSHPVPFEREVE